MGVYLSKVLYQAQQNVLVFYCPGCKERHLFEVHPHIKAKWTWDGNVEKPTITPSLIFHGNSSRRCHLNVKEGLIHFCQDSSHRFAGQEIPMWPVDLEDRYKMKIEDTYHVTKEPKESS